MKTFQETVKSLLADRKISYYALASKTGTSRQTLYNWTNGKVVPSAEKVNLLLETLGLDETSVREVQQLRIEARQDRPRTRSRKTAKKEWLWAKKLKMQLKNKKIEFEDGETPYFDLSIRSSHPWKTECSVIPLLLRLKVPSYSAIFAQACEAMRRTNARTAVAIVPEIKPHQYAKLFEHHRIEFLTEEQFLDREWFSPIKDQAEFPLGGC
jgi:transcriptional regulator with XRE-family HTH domain